jgi:DNA-binding winged helix-turn-helix (wHTH) protein
MERVHNLQFGPFRLVPEDKRLWRGVDAIVLRPKSFAVLRYLVEQAGRLVTKEELAEAVWPGLVVSEAALTVCMGDIRKALGDDARAPHFIATVHRRGYRFIRCSI